MRFKLRHRPTSYFTRGEQLRLLGMCALLFMTILAFQKASDPDTWRWLFLGQNTPQQPEEELQDISYLVRDSGTSLKPEEFLAEVIGSPNAEPQEATPPESLTIDPAWLEPVLDQTVGWRSRTEFQSLLKVLDKIQGMDPEEVRQGAQHDVSFRFLNNQPELFRGRLIHLRGLLWRLEEFQKGDEQTDAIYAGWMFTEDSGNKPWLVLCPQLPEGLGLASQLERPVTVNGYFFKRYGYETVGQQLNVAPLVVAQGFELLPLPPVAQEQAQSNTATYAVLGVLVGALGAISLIAWFFWQSDRQFAKSRLGQYVAHGTPLPPEDLAALQTLSVAPSDSPVAGVELPAETQS